MKRFASTFLLFLAPIAWSQLKTGTVIYVDLAKNPPEKVAAIKQAFRRFGLL